MTYNQDLIHSSFLLQSIDGNTPLSMLHLFNLCFSIISIGGCVVERVKLKKQEKEEQKHRLDLSPHKFIYAKFINEGEHRILHSAEKVIL